MTQPAPAPRPGPPPGAKPGPEPGAPPGHEPRSQRTVLIVFGAVIALAAVAFGYKFYEFFIDLSRQEGFRFAGAELLTYLLVAGGFFLLLAYAFLRGHFTDIEQPKHDLLDAERRRDHDEFD